MSELLHEVSVGPIREGVDMLLVLETLTAPVPFDLHLSVDNVPTLPSTIPCRLGGVGQFPCVLKIDLDHGVKHVSIAMATRHEPDRWDKRMILHFGPGECGLARLSRDTTGGGVIWYIFQ